MSTGKVRGYEGHHINSVKANTLEKAKDPDNVTFVKGREEHLAAHDGNFQNPTSGPLLDRLGGYSGAALLAFFETFEQKMQEYAADSKVLSDPDSWGSYINPANTLAEIAALAEAYVAAENAELEYRKQEKEEEAARTGG